MSYRNGSSIVRFAAIAALAALAGCNRAPESPPPAAAMEPAADAAASPDVHRFNIGTLEALVLRDGGVSFPNDNAVFGIGLQSKDVASVLAAAGLPTEQLELSIQPLVVRAADRVLLFDTGASSNFGPGAGKLQASLAAAGVTAADITDIFISHLHGDHVGGLIDAAGALAFPNAGVRIAAAEWQVLRGLTAEQGAGFGIGNVTSLVAAVAPKVVTFEAGAEIIPGVVRAVDVKGHTAGHSAYLIGSGADSLLYIGDSLHHYVVSVQKPEWNLAFDSDQATAAASRQQLLQQNAASGQRIHAVHFPFPGLGRFTSQGGGFAWSPE